MDFNITTDKDIRVLGKDLGMWLWNIAVSLAPYDTGALRKAITLNSANDKNIKIVYNAFNAYYLHFLEEGQGPITKHKGFISELTVGNFVQEIINHFITGKKPLITSKPMTTLRRSEQGPMFYEKKVLSYLGFKNVMTITGDDRINISNLRFNTKNNTFRTKVGGLQTEVRRLYQKRDNINLRYAYLDERSYEKPQRVGTVI